MVARCCSFTREWGCFASQSADRRQNGTQNVATQQGKCCFRPQAAAYAEAVLQAIWLNQTRPR
eukprot:193408-Alexandrium_andersonii.AAC.1